MLDLRRKIEQNLSGKNIDAYELYLEKKHTIQIEAKEAAIDAFEDAVSYGLALRVRKNNRVGFSYGTSEDSSSLSHLVHAAVVGIDYVDPNPELDFFQDFKQAQYQDTHNFDATLPGLAMPKRLQMALDVERCAKSFNAKIKTVRESSYNEVQEDIYLYNSYGMELTSQRSYCSVSVLAIAESDGQNESAYEFDGHVHLQDLNPEWVGENAAKLALGYLGAKIPDSQECPVIFDSAVMSNMLDIFVFSFLGDTIYKKLSIIKNHLGQNYFHPSLNLYDNHLLVEGRATQSFDAIGSPSQTTVLVKQGVIKNFLCDQEYAKKLKLPDTANAVRARSYLAAPSLGMSNIVLSPGTESLTDLFKRMDKGFYITDVMGMHMADEISGDFSVGAQGFYIEGGEKKFPVKNMAIAGNIHELMKNIVAIGNDRRIYSNMDCPSIMFKNISISGK